MSEIEISEDKTKNWMAGFGVLGEAYQFTMQLVV